MWALRKSNLRDFDSWLITAIIASARWS